MINIKGSTDAMADKGTVPERRMFRVFLVLAIVTTIISLAITLFEIKSFPKPESKKQSSGVPVLPSSLKPPAPPLSMLPDFVLQYATRGRQEIPNSKYPAAEALYEILDGNIMLASPINSYAKATFFPSQEEAEKDIRETIEERYPKNREDLLIGSTIAKAGYDEREGSYFIGWTKQGYSIKIHTSFVDHIPVEKRNSLRDHALPLAKAIELISSGNK